MAEKERIHTWLEISRYPDQIASQISIHVISDPNLDQNFESVQRLDPYFQNIQEVASFKAFVNLVESKALPHTTY